jgi:hypothetical protein
MFLETKFVKVSLCLLSAVACLSAADRGKRPIDVGEHDTIFPHVAAGSGWTTTIKLVNVWDGTVSDADRTVELRFYTDNGDPWKVQLSDGQTSISSAHYSATIPAFNGSISVDVLGSTDVDSNNKPIVTGWAELIYTWDAVIGGMAVFRYNTSQQNRNNPQSLHNESDWEATVPVSANNNQNGFALVFDQTVIRNLRADVANTQLAAGIALANPDSTPITITVQAFDEAGIALPLDSAGDTSDVFTLPGKGHGSFMLTSWYPSLAGKRGVVQFKTDNSQDLAGLGLRVNPTGSVSSLHTLTYY